MSPTILCIAGVVSIAAGAVALLVRGRLSEAAARRLSTALLVLSLAYTIALVSAVAVRVREGLDTQAFEQMEWTEFLITGAVWFLMLIAVVAPLWEIATHLRTGGRRR